MFNILFKVRWLSGCLIFLLLSCKNDPSSKAVVSVNDSSAIKLHLAKTETALVEMEKQIRSGDIVTRAGADFTSRSLSSLNRRDKTFSHCGIASVENGSVFIYHALGGEWNPDQRLMREPFISFANPYDNRAAGIFRFGIPDSMKVKLVQQAKKYFGLRVKFDMDFDLKTDDKLYCAEFVYKSFISATDSSILLHHSILGELEFIGVDDITLDPKSAKIAVLNYGIY